MRTAFLGTPDAAVPILDALSTISDVALVITRPDQARGRSKDPRPSAVRLAAELAGLDVATPRNRQELGSVVAGLEIDIAIVAAFGMIIPVSVLECPRKGMVNVHYSLLPAWRGAAPVERCIVAGDPVTGVTLMKVDAGLDTGPTYSSWKTAVGADETAGSLMRRLAVGGGELLTVELGPIAAGERHPKPQSLEGVSYASRLTTAEARLDWSLAAHDIARHVRAFNPRPGAHTRWRETRLKVHRSRPVPSSLGPGRLEMIDDELVAGTGTGGVVLIEIQPAGGRAMSGAAWSRGVHGSLGSFE